MPAQQNPQSSNDWITKPATKNFRGIGGVKAAGEVSMISPEQAKFYAEELKRCKDDIVYFAENYFYIISYRGKEKIKLYEKQKEMVKGFVEHPFNVILSGRQQGKCVSGQTKIKIRNKKTKKEELISIEDFYGRIKNQASSNEHDV